MMEPPPSYDETVKKGPSGAPPTYEELFPVKEMREQVRQARNDGKPVTIPGILCDLLCKSFLCGCCYITLAALPITLIIIGSIYVHKCTIQDRIPIFLIVFGCVSLLQTTLGIIKMCLCRGEDENEQRKRKGGNFCESLITTFLFIWIIVGSYYTFSVYDSWVDGGKLSCSAGGASNLCCDAVPMYFSFVFLLLIYGIAAIGFFCIVCCVCCVGLSS